MNMDIQAALEVADETDAFLQISDLIFEKGQSAGFDSLTSSEKTFFCVDGFLREMGSGGLSQFFNTDAGRYVQATIEALKTVRAPQAQSIMEQAKACFPDEEVPSDLDDRSREFSKIEENYAELITKLEDRFYNTESELVRNTLKYVSDNLRDFK